MIAIYDENRIKSETKQVLYWMSRAARYLRAGNGRMAHHAITTALSHSIEIACTQERLITQNGFDTDVGLNYAEIYEKAVRQAQKEAGEDDA